MNSKSTGAFIILDWHANVLPAVDPSFRNRLLDGGIAKGTASKMVQILGALRSGLLAKSEVTSINGAYALIKVADLESIKRRVRGLTDSDRAALRAWLEVA